MWQQSPQFLVSQFRRREIKRSALIDETLGPDLAAMAMYDSLHGCQSNPRTFKCIRLMQALKHAKQFVHILHIESHAVILDEHHHFVAASIRGSNLNFRLGSRARELNRVGKKIHQRQPEHRPVSVEIRQFPDLPNNIAAAGLLPDLRERFPYQLLQADPRLLSLSPSDS